MDGISFEVARLYRLDGGKGALKAFVDVTVSNSLLIKGIRVVSGKNGLFVSMPREVGKDGKWYETIRPASKEVRESLSEAVLKEFEATA